MPKGDQFSWRGPLEPQEAGKAAGIAKGDGSGELAELTGEAERRSLLKVYGGQNCCSKAQDRCWVFTDKVALACSGLVYR